ncbi:hypothetical protein [Emticicia sp. TH156]|uniref:hypothetical protein n=1 Tax=Emticicia sp. TH156 TaxID=2067454 RepID=UPI000C7796EA|nr:hypothetical protein [Emticicia sp. TH156]PLK42096.1 hypothetical protein C0V77_22675 [Emticicia sp. TH156]
MKINRHIFTIALLLAIIFNYCWVYSQNKNNASNYLGIPSKAIIRSQNDFVTYSDTVSLKEEIPPVVRSKMKSLIKGSDYSENNLVFKVTYSSSVFIYIFKTYSFSIVRFYLIAYDAKNDRVSTISPSINGKWMENNEQGFSTRLLYEPLIEFQDFDNDNRNEIIIKERVHNGTFYNAVINNYFKLDKYLEFKKVFALESYYKTPIDDCIIRRTLKGRKVISELKCDSHDFSPVGEADLEFSRNVRIKSKNSIDEKYKGLLITGSGLNETVFINKGYSIAY